jgi:formylglycine-generating enzyme
MAFMSGISLPFLMLNYRLRHLASEANDHYKNSSPVGVYRPNGLGLYDMTGNVWQWCADWYDAKYYRYSSRENPQGASTGKHHVIRGGSWANTATSVRSANRNDEDSAGRSSNLGFRLVYTLDEK